jgi:tetratricopeptide (TPR) repeat protein
MNPLRSRYLPLLVLAVPVVVYLNAWQNPFHYDDRHALLDNPHIRTLANLPAFFVDPRLFSANPDFAMYRPLLLCTFALNHALSGYEVWSYHLFNLALHLWAAWLVFRLGELLLGDRAWAGLAALLFGAHPVNSEAVNYLSSRSEVLAGAFLLWGLRCFLGRRGPGWVGGAFLAGLLTKSTAIALPAVLACHQLIFPGRPLKQERRLYLVLGGLALAYVLGTWRFLHKAALSAPVRSYGEQWWSQVKGVVFYLKLLLWPSGLNVDHQFQVSDSLFDPFAASAFALVLSLLWLAFRHRRRHPLPLFLLLFGLLALAPASLVPLNVLVNEHRLYVPSAAFALALAYGAGRLTRKWGEGVGWAGLAAVVGLGIATFARNQVWKSELSLWSDAVAKAPDMARPRFVLAAALAQAGELGRAIQTMEEGLKRDPNFLAGYASIGQWWKDQGDLGRAAGAYTRGLQVPPTGKPDEQAQRAGLWAGLGEVRGPAAEAQGQPADWQGSLQAYQKALELVPDQSDLYNNAGNVLQELGRPAEALALHQRALELNPADPRTWVNLGFDHFALKDLAAARGDFARAAELAPDYALAWINLAVVQEQLGDRQGAAESRRRAARLGGRP